MAIPQLAAATTRIGVMLSEAQFVDAWREAGGDDPQRRALLAEQARAYLLALRESRSDPAVTPMLPDPVTVNDVEVEMRREARLRGLMCQRHGVCG